MNKINKHKLAIAIIKLCQKKEQLIADCQKKLVIENMKPLTERFMFVSNDYYHEQINDAQEALKWLELRYENLIKNL